MSASVGIDIGGTFTDVMICPDDGGPVTIAKVPTTPHDPGEGLVIGLTGALAAAGLSPGDITWLVHGTTVGTNAILEHDGARIGIITTCGFEDLLYIGRAKRSAMYDLFTGPATPGFLCPRRRVRGVPGRVSSGGATVEPLDERAAEDAIDYLTDVEGVSAIAVCLLFSFADPEMERRIQQIIHARHPAVHVSLSSNIDPRFREFERLVVTAFDAYIKPKVGSYLQGLRGRLSRAGVSVPLHVMESHGGIVDSDQIEHRAVGTLLSGLAGGAIGAAAIGAAVGRDRVLSLDMGGTSTDVTLIEGGRPLIHDEGRIADQPVRLPMVDVRPIGAGGGSIAYVDAAGSLRVGPRSAGADPGPASYGRGGREPTVTDANLILGFLGEDGLAGGRLQLSRDLAEKALHARVADPLGMDVVEAAWGVHRLVNAAMAAAVRVVSVGRGHDPRRFALAACGGAGPLHACSIADDLGIEEILVPPHPGVLSAYGLLSADVRVPRWRTFHAPLGETEPADLQGALDEVTAEAIEGLSHAAARADTDVLIERTVDARYVGQSHELTVTVPAETGPDQLAFTISARFGELHRRFYGQHDRDGQVEVTAVRATATLPRATPPPRRSASRGRVGERDLYLPERGVFQTAPVLHRDAVSEPVPGPAVIVQDDTTILVRLGWTARPHTGAVLAITREPPGSARRSAKADQK